MGADQELRPNDSDTGLILELTTEITSELRGGGLTERYKVEIEDEEYVAQPDEDIKQVDVNQIVIRE